MIMFKIILIILAFAIIGLLCTVAAGWIRKWTIRREVRRLKAVCAQLRKAIAEAEEMKSAITNWTARRSARH